MLVCRWGAQEPREPGLSPPHQLPEECVQQHEEEVCHHEAVQLLAHEVLPALQPTGSALGPPASPLTPLARPAHLWPPTWVPWVGRGQDPCHPRIPGLGLAVVQMEPGEGWEAALLCGAKPTPPTSAAPPSPSTAQIPAHLVLQGAHPAAQPVVAKNPQDNHLQDEVPVEGETCRLREGCLTGRGRTLGSPTWPLTCRWPRTPPSPGSPASPGQPARGTGRAPPG